MRQGIVRAIKVACLSLAIAALAEGVYSGLLCTQHQAWVHARTGRRVIALTHSFGVPRFGDMTFACERPHRFGSLVLHTDLVCFCGPLDSRNEIAVQARGPCAADPPPGGGAPLCPPAYCDEHVGP